MKLENAGENENEDEEANIDKNMEENENIQNLELGNIIPMSPDPTFELTALMFPPAQATGAEVLDRYPLY